MRGGGDQPFDSQESTQRPSDIMGLSDEVDNHRRKLLKEVNLFYPENKCKNVLRSIKPGLMNLHSSSLWLIWIRLIISVYQFLYFRLQCSFEVIYLTSRLIWSDWVWLRYVSTGSHVDSLITLLSHQTQLQLCQYCHTWLAT